MKYFVTSAFIVFASLINIRGFSQDSLYANRIDSLWHNSHIERELKSKRTKVGDASIQYSFYKRSGQMRSVVSLNSVARENLIFFYLEDKIVMIWPSGQRPYFILNDKLVYAVQMRHTAEQVDNLIARAYNYLEQGYKKIKGASN